MRIRSGNFHLGATTRNKSFRHDTENLFLQRTGFEAFERTTKLKPASAVEISTVPPAL
jgi:hypothetical protein